MPVTAQQAQKEIEARNFTRGDAPVIPSRVRQLAETHQVYIFNVGPKPWIQEMGGRGPFRIAPCADGQAYSAPTIIPGIVHEAIPVDIRKVEYKEWDGLDVARDIIGLGSHRNPNNSLIPWGVFVSETNPPKKAELEAAHAELDKTALRLLGEGDDFHNAGPQQYVNITTDHRWALRRTNQVRTWGQPLAKMETCPGCQEALKPGVVVHTCGAVLDWDKAINLGIKRAEDRPNAPFPPSAERPVKSKAASL